MASLGFKQFASRLQEKLKARVSLFEEHMRQYYEKNPDLQQTKTNKEWMIEFKKWSDSQAQLELVIDIILFKR
jgi:hypothetical protein